MEDNEKAKGTTVRDQVKKFLGDKTLYNQGEVKNELVIRTGDAENIDYPNRVDISGIITAPASFFSKRKDLHNPDKCHLLFDKQKGQIKLIVDEQNSDAGYVIVGSLTPNPDLNEFNLKVSGLSTGKIPIKLLMEKLKFNKYFFVDKALNATIATYLMNFKAKVQTEIEAVNNQRGDQRDLKATQLSHELAEFFIIKMPIYKGLSPVEFKVEIRCEITSTGDVVTWLESSELGELNKSALETVINAELDLFKEIVCIEQ